MKKFLTVLLVIAVMFTFSFSSAFATAGDTNAITALEFVGGTNTTVCNVTGSAASGYVVTLAITSGTNASYTVKVTGAGEDLIYWCNDYSAASSKPAGEDWSWQQVSSGEITTTGSVKSFTVGTTKEFFAIGRAQSRYITTVTKQSGSDLTNAIHITLKLVDDTTMTLQAYDLASAKSQAVQTGLNYIDLTKYDAEGQLKVLRAYETLGTVVATATTVKAVNDAYYTFKTTVDAVKKTTDAAKTAKQYGAKINAYAELLGVVTGLDYSTWTNRTYTGLTVTEVEALYAEDVKAVNEIANEYVEKAATPDTTLATAADKNALVDKLAQYVADYGTDVALYAQLKAVAMEGAEKVNAATTKAELVDLKDAYLGEAASYKYATSTTKGVYKKAAVADGALVAIVKGQVAGSTTVKNAKKAAFAELSAWLEANYSANEMLKNNWNEAEGFIAAVAKAATNGTVDYATFTNGDFGFKVDDPTTYVLAGKAYYQSLTRAYSEVENLAVNYDFEKTYKKYTDLTKLSENAALFVAADRVAFATAVYTYNEAVDAAYTVAAVRQAQADFVAAVSALTKTDVEKLASLKLEAERLFAADIVTLTNKGYFSSDAQKAIDVLTADVKAYINGKYKATTDKNAYKLTEAYKALEKVMQTERKATAQLAAASSAATDTSIEYLRNYLIYKLVNNSSVTVTGTNVDVWPAYATESDAARVASATNYAGADVYSYDQTIVGDLANNLINTTFTSATVLLSSYDYISAEIAKYVPTAVTDYNKLYAKLATQLADLGTADKTATTLKKFDDLKSLLVKLVAEMEATPTSLCSAAEKAAIKAALPVLADYGYAYDFAYYYVPGKILSYSAVATEWAAANAAYNGVKTLFSAADQAAYEKAVALAGIKAAGVTTAAEYDAIYAELLAQVVAMVPVNAEKVTAGNAATLAALKTLAANYFAKYESKVFTSAAANTEQLRDEIIAGGAKSVIEDVKVTTKNVANGIQVTCDQVAGATSYKFYRATSLNGTYKFMLEKTTNTYTNTSAKKGNKYYYKVTVVVNGVESDLSTHTGVRTCK